MAIPRRRGYPKIPIFPCVETGRLGDDGYPTVGFLCPKCLKLQEHSAGPHGICCREHLYASQCEHWPLGYALRDTTTLWNQGGRCWLDPEVVREVMASFPPGHAFHDGAYKPPRPPRPWKPRPDTSQWPC